MTVAADPLAPFSPAVRAWFESAFEAPTPAQVGGWASISTGGHTLIHAPTGSGKTLAAFLWCLDRLARDPSPPPSRTNPGSVRVLYVSPLKALTYDVERNLRAPLHGIGLAAQRLGEAEPRISIAGRTGDTPADVRRELARRPPDILVTTPESLYLMLTSAAREVLRGVETVIVDEVHAIAGTKRGAHLALSLERLERLRPTDAPPLQRIGLSATQRPLETIARFLGGIGPGREVEIVDAGSRKALELEVVVPVEDMARLGEVLPPEEQPGGPVAFGDLRTSIWPAIHPRLLELIRAHRSTIVFTNSRRLAERLAQRLNEAAGEELVLAHHGSIAREQRLRIEEDLKAGRIPGLVATSSLELGIDMGAVDLVVLVESPTSVASGLQRVGRAGHQVGEPSKGIVFPKFRGDLLEAAVVVQRMHEGAIETTVMPRNPLDVLAQQLVAMAVMDRWTVAELLEIVNRAAPFETLSREALEAVLGMLAGAYPSDEFAELKARLLWDRVTDVVEGRRDARVVAVTSGGTIPDRGLFGVFLAGEAGTPGRRVGELDEEMVYELRAGMHGDVVVLGASSWRVLDITPDRVIVEPAPGVPGKLPFWKGDAVGRPVELGRAIGSFLREAEADLARGEKGVRSLTARLREQHDLDELAARNLVAYLDEERETAGALATDRRVVVQRFRDELGDWRLVILSPFGGRVHAPLTLAIETRLRERLGIEAQTIWSDDGIAVRLPEGEGDGDARRLADIEALLFPAAEEVEDLVVEAVGGSALFASRFRENAGRALLLPRRRPGARTPLWQQRQRAADLLQVASRYGSFPILVETYRECLSDVFDLDALREILGGIERREIAVHGVETAKASPFASSLLFDYVAAYMYEGDAPWPSDAPARWRSTATCCASSWARRSCASCSTPRPWPTWSCRSSTSPTTGRPTARSTCTTSCAASATCRRRRRPRGSRAGRRSRIRGCASSPPRAVRSRCASPATTAGSPSRTWGGIGTASAPRRRGVFRRPSSSGWPAPWTGCSRAGPAATGRSSPASPPPAGACRWAWSRTRWRASPRPAPSCAASSARRAPSASGATRRSCACSGAARWLGCGARWNLSSRRRSGASCRRGRAWPRSGRTCRRSAGAPPWSGSRRSWTSSRGCRSPPRCWSVTCCRPGSRATSRGCSTSWARWARWRGSATAASAATTAGWCSTGRVAS